MASGSDALLLSLMELDIQPGDEVLTVPFTFFASTGVISRLHARPVFVDVCADTFNLDPNDNWPIKSRREPKRFFQCISLGNVRIWKPSIKWLMRMVFRSLKMLAKQLVRLEMVPKPEPLGVPVVLVSSHQKI